ncbi:peptidoglycan binding protein CsiV [Photobacterium sp. OFAV2-7]|uniref:peptidoglycan binding protein CsiV n=1 Tax=Photobacterium sp. OFAV2-7 TaxID=2917748 RepID=UPI001EF41B53|nr:peptidoglycan binding protein CsiV [Photobacterium sp. OFAV2-7]MCG7586730.1 peptidoglycan binding protein CsiV [Photobacterium sp. OFAV2-7]
MKKLIYLLLIAISWPSLAARQFDIEVILFKRNIDPAQVSEAWPDQQKPVNMKGTVSFDDESLLASKDISLMLPEQFQLTPQYDKLRGHAGFTPLAHFGWRQGDLSKAAAPKFHLTAGKDYSAQYLADGTSKAALSRETSPQPEPPAIAESETAITADGLPATTEMPAVAPEPPLYELEGSIRVYVQHFLFTETSLDLREPGRREVIVGAEPIDLETDLLAEDSNVQVGHLQEVKKKVEVEEFLKSYRFEQQRKMRSGETHYLDHPLMGMVIQIRRVEE